MQNTTWEANRSSAIQKIPRILWNPNVHHRIHNSKPFSLSWARQVHSRPFYSTLTFISTYFHLLLSSGLFPSGYWTIIRNAFSDSLYTFSLLTVQIVASFLVTPCDDSSDEDCDVDRHTHIDVVSAVVSWLRVRGDLQQEDVLPLAWLGVKRSPPQTLCVLISGSSRIKTRHVLCKHTIVLCGSAALAEQGNS